ncbi:MAG: hypothetical protein RIK87_17915 [Fuerstiella sp.]
MFFRFAAALTLVVLVSMVGIGLEKQTLEMKRAVSRQYFQKDLLLEMHAKKRLRIQQLTAPSQLAAGRLQHAGASNVRPSSGESTWSMPKPKPAEQTPARENVSAGPGQRRLPLLRWEHPAPARQRP